MKKFSLNLITIFLVSAAVGLGLWLVNKNFPASGFLEISAVLGQDRPAISRLGPDPRVKLENGVQAIIEGPVYFDLRAPRWFNQAHLEITYWPAGRTFKALGGKVADPWSYLIKEPLAVVAEENNWQTAIFEFDLNQLLSQKNVKRFVFDTQGETGQLLWLKSIKVILQR